MKYLGNNANILRTAALSMTNIVASDAVYRTDTDAKNGGGQVSLSGSYTGQTDSVFEVEIVDNTIVGTPRVSNPIFTGVGNGVLSSLAATSAVTAQEIKISLVDLGTQTRKAYAPLQGVTIQAKVAGTGGNSITLTIDQSGITRTASGFALTEQLKQGQNEYVGDHWNFGAVVIAPDGTIPTTAPRVAFGDDPQIYRSYKKFVDGRYVYSFSPKPIRDVAAGEKVFIVTGTRTATVTNGATTETYNSITTLYDLLSGIQASSTLVSIVGVVAKDYNPNGMAIDDLSVQTSSYFLNLVKDGSRNIKHATIGLAVDSNAPTEHLVIECAPGPKAGQEKWLVSGSVSGDLPDATTGVLYNSGPVSFTIPIQTVLNNSPEGEITGVYEPTSGHPEDFSPCFNLYKPKLGINATSKTLTWVYQKRKAPACDCEAQPGIGGPSDDCLGVDTGGNMATLSDPHRLRIERVRTWASDWIKTCRHVADVNLTDSGRADISTESADLRVARSVTDILLNALSALYTNSDAKLRNTAWQASHLYALDDIREPVTENGYRYRVSVKGTSAGSEPTWPTTIGATVTDGGVTWECIGKTPIAFFDQELLTVQSELARWIDAPKATIWVNITTSDLPIYQRLIPTTRNGHSYICVKRPVGNTGATAVTEPTWPTNGSTVADGDLVWQDAGAYWPASTVVTVGTILIPFNGRIFKCTTGGTTGASEPASWDAQKVTDNGVVWTCLNSPTIGSTIQADVNAAGADVAEYAGTFAEQMSVVLAAAGLASSFNQASLLGNECWHDYPDKDHWWVCTDDPNYLPIFTNVYYHSVKTSHDANGDPILVNTKEFGFRFQFCESDLLEGDTVRITISAAGVSALTYQAGDRIEFDVNYSSPVQLGGGQTGNDTLTFNVIGTSQSFTQYALNTVTLNSYSNAGLSFLITPGAIDFKLGDTYTFTVEGGRFKFRKDGGSWSANTSIQPTVSLSDGLSGVFQSGAAPSWITGDKWTFTAEAINGPDQLRQPTDSRAAWVNSTVLTITPSASASASAILLCDHTIPSNAVIVLQGSNDNFATTPLNLTLTWRSDSIYATFTQASYAKYRITCDKGGTAQWPWLGDGLELKIPGGITELGKLKKKLRFPGLVARRALGVTVDHEALTKDSIDSLLDMLSHACEYDDRRIAIIPNDAEPDEVSLVQYSSDSLDIEDILDFQPRDHAYQLSKVSLTLEPTP